MLLYAILSCWTFVNTSLCTFHISADVTNLLYEPWKYFYLLNEKTTEDNSWYAGNNMSSIPSRTHLIFSNHMLVLRKKVPEIKDVSHFLCEYWRKLETWFSNQPFSQKMAATLLCNFHNASVGNMCSSIYLLWNLVWADNILRNFIIWKHMLH